MSRRFWHLLVFVMLLAGCGDNPLSPLYNTTPPVLKNSPLDPGKISYIIPMGNLNPPGHTTPTDHIYLTLADRYGNYPVYAPADGIVTEIRQPENDYKIDVMVNNSLSYYLDHLLIDPSVKKGVFVRAGQVIGRTSGMASALDLGVVNQAVTLSYANRGRYNDQALHTDAPLKYYEEPLRSQLYALVRRTGSEKDGKIDFDIPGRLAGNWFLEGLSPSQSFDRSGWDKQLAFVYDNYDPSKIRVSIGGVIASAGVFGVLSGDPAPGDVSVASGIVAYRLVLRGSFGTDTTSRAGLLLVQMLADDRIQVEYFSGSLDTASFTSAARIYVR